ncbi:hypothetical protein F8S13_24065 [Chloroflexia bacterium SDU3-3]|nr:hypothetical protein F8S13_24065 [Chloroflexia bacterium SDU3-3]
MFSWLKKRRSPAQPPAPDRQGPRFSDHFSADSGGAVSGSYAMWFPSAEETPASLAHALGVIDRVYESMDSIETFALAEILGCFGGIERDVMRVTLPDETAILPMRSAAGLSFLLSVSQEKGIRLHFLRSAPDDLRAEALSSFTSYFAARRQQIIQDLLGIPTPPATTYVGKAWWDTMKEVASGLQKEGVPMEKFGTIIYQA